MNRVSLWGGSYAEDRWVYFFRHTNHSHPHTYAKVKICLFLFSHVAA